MGQFVCLLRGINVGGRNKLPMADLKKAFEELKFANIVTYIQSGNIIFDSRKSKPSTLAAKIKTKIRDTFQLEVPVLVCEAERFSEIASEHPFEARANDIKHLHVTFLEKPPIGKSFEKLIAAAEDFKDEYLLVDQEVYLFCPGGYAKTKLTNDFFEKQLGVVATTRNWNSVSKIVQLLTD